MINEEIFFTLKNLKNELCLDLIQKIIDNDIILNVYVCSFEGPNLLKDENYLEQRELDDILYNYRYTDYIVKIKIIKEYIYTSGEDVLLDNKKKSYTFKVDFYKTNRLDFNYLEKVDYIVLNFQNSLSFNNKPTNLRLLNELNSIINKLNELNGDLINDIIIKNIIIKNII